MVIKMKNADIVFNSQEVANGKNFQIASGYISDTVVLFKNENIVAVINAKGIVEFYDINDTLLAKGELPENDGGKNVYEEIFCQAENGVITIKFPILEWIDNYPHCDGEHDRWDSKKIGEHILVFTPKTGLLELM